MEFRTMYFDAVEYWIIEITLPEWWFVINNTAKLMELSNCFFFF